MPTQSEQKSCLPPSALKTTSERNSLEEAAEMAHSLSQITRADRSYYPLRRELSTALNALFTDEHRNTALSNAPGGRDPAGHAVRYLRSVSWHELFILLSEDKIAFPHLHKNLEHQLSDEHGARF